MAFIDHLTQKGILKKSEAEEVSEEVNAGTDLDEVLEKRGIDESKLLELRGEYFNMPTKDVSGVEVPFDVLKNVPEESALYYKFAPIGVEDNTLQIGIVDPDNIGARDAIQFISSKMDMPYKLFLISRSDFDIILDQYKGISGEVNKALSELETELDDGSSGKQERKEFGGSAGQYGNLEELSNDPSQTQIIEEAPVTKIVAVVLRHAIEGKASDIHIEPTEEKIRVRFRVDGVMYTSLLLPQKVKDAVVARIKILANLKLDEKRKPQDGRFGARISGRKVDFRVSTFPTYYGEKVVMRILDKEKGVQKLEELGLRDMHAQTIRDALNQPYGMILLTGPTGSGKTTTLYSMLSEVDRDKVNVVSLEDPIEYNIPGMSQSQVRPEIGYTFANGLRSILRQDPDVIMVGEIRDEETARLAIQAALTGHLVFSTLHTNTAAGVIPRLVDMGVDPYLIAPTLILAIGQRLVKTFCPDSSEPRELSEAEQEMIKAQVADLPEDVRTQFTSIDTVHEPIQTESCPTGMRGRTAVYELLPITKGIERVILERPVEDEVYTQARADGMITMKEDAMLKAAEGEIPFEQVNELG